MGRFRVQGPTLPGLRLPTTTCNRKILSSIQLLFNQRTFQQSSFRFIHSGYFYSASSSPLLLRGAPDTARILCRNFTPKRHRQLWVKDLPKVPTWRLEQESKPWPFGRKAATQPMSHPRHLANKCSTEWYTGLQVSTFLRVTSVIFIYWYITNLLGTFISWPETSRLSNSVVVGEGFDQGSDTVTISEEESGA